MTSFINDNGQEILVSEEVTLTKQVASFKEFKIKGDFSVTLKIHNNSKNREALGYYGLNQIDSPIFSPNKFNLVKNGNVLKRGDIVIESDDGKFISIYFIAGNSNWFRAFDFSCKDVRNDSLAVQWNYTNVITASTATSGIVFPHIDFMFGREKFDKYNFNSRIVNDSTGAVDDYSPVNNSPCIYLSTLVNEISKVGGIKIAGNILTDWLYTHVIITPDGPEIYNDSGQIVTANAGAPTSSGGNDTIYIQNISPDIKAIELIKWVCFSFGCIPYFNEYSQTLNLNLIRKIQKEDAVDWTNYLDSYIVRYDQQNKNYIRVQSPQEDEIKLYNQVNTEVKYGELNIETHKTDGSTIDLYTSPFAPSKDAIGTTDLLWATPFVQFYELEDSDSLTYSSVVTELSKAKFSGMTVDFAISGIGFGTNLIVRVEDAGGVYDGYHLIEAATTTTLRSSCDFISDSTGTIYPQKVTKVTSKPRALIAIPNFAVSNFTANSTIEVYAYGAVSNVMYAYYHKPIYSYTGLNAYKSGLSYGDIEGQNDFPLVDNLDTVVNMVENPTVESKMKLPEAIFNDYEFDQFIYLKDLGYFLAEKIDNYKDGVTPVRVDLIKVD